MQTSSTKALLLEHFINLRKQIEYPFRKVISVGSEDKGPGFSHMIPQMYFSTSARFKNILTLTNPRSSLLRWLTLRAEVIKSQWGPGYKVIFIEVILWCMPSAPPKPPLIKWREAYLCYFSVLVFPLASLEIFLLTLDRIVNIIIC